MKQLWARMGDVLFGGVFFLVGMTFVLLLGTSAMETLVLPLRAPVEVRVVQTEIVPADSGQPGFTLVIRFRQPGRPEMERADFHGSDYRDLVRVQRTLPAGALLIGRRLRADAPLQLDLCEGGWARLFWFPVFMAIPVMFAWIGARVVWGGVRGIRRERGDTAPSPKWLVFAGGSLFLLGGIYVVTAMLVLPTWNWVRARAWVPATATIEMSRSVVTRTSKGGMSHHPEVLYRYGWRGQIHRSSGISILDAQGGEVRTEAFLRGYPVGQTTTCWMNPDDPTEAVLDRSLSWWMLLGVPFAAFPVIGWMLLRTGWEGLGRFRSGTRLAGGN